MCCFHNVPKTSCNTCSSDNLFNTKLFLNGYLQRLKCHGPGGWEDRMCIRTHAMLATLIATTVILHSDRQKNHTLSSCFVYCGVPSSQAHNVILRVRYLRGGIYCCVPSSQAHNVILRVRYICGGIYSGVPSSQAHNVILRVGYLRGGRRRSLICHTRTFSTPLWYSKDRWR